MTARENVESALERAGSRRVGKDWTCPSHKGGGEKDPSLSVNDGDNGVVLHCHAGCTVDEVLRAINLKMSDLFDTPPPGKQDKKTIVATYPYQYEDNKVGYEVVRYDPKDFRQRVPDEDRAGSWKWSLNGIRRVPYHLPRLIEAVHQNRVIHICEGEKDVHAVEDVGGVATCNPGGAGKWRSEYAEFFRGAHVKIIADNDAAGIKHAGEVMFSIAGVTNGVEIVKPKEGKDAYDHIKRYGYTLDEFLVSAILDDPALHETSNLNPIEAKFLSIDEIDNLPEPTYLIDDLVVSDSLCVLFGLPGHGKSFIALDWALSVAHGVEQWVGKSVMSGPVLYVAAEGASGIGKRKRAWRKKHPTHTKGDLVWLPEPVDLLDPESVAYLLEAIDKLQPIMVIIDTLARSMPGADENAPAPMSTAIESLDAIRRTTRAAIVIVHHTPKDGSTPRGHSSLLGAVQTSIKCSMVDGAITLSVEKQKDGAPIEMNLHLTRVDDSAVIELGGFDNRSPTEFHELMIVKALRENSVGGGALSTNLVRELSGVSKSAFYRHLKALQESGRVVEHGRNRISLVVPSQ